MTAREALSQMVALGLMPSDSAEDVLRVAELVDRKVAAGKLTQEQGDLICENHAMRVVDSRVATQGAFTENDQALADAIGRALDAPGWPS